MTTTTGEQQTTPSQPTKQKPTTEQGHHKLGTDEKSFLFDDEKGSNRTSTTMTTPQTNAVGDGGTSIAISVQYDVEHLATFSTATSHEQQVGAAKSATTANDKRDRSSKFKLKQTPTNDSPVDPIAKPSDALQRLFELEKSSGIWTQRMQIGLQQEFMLIVDCETNSVSERFHRDRVTKPKAFDNYNDIYNNIIVFSIDQHDEGEPEAIQEDDGDESFRDCDRTPGELHIFKCVSHEAKQLVADILTWKSAPKEACMPTPNGVEQNEENKTKSSPSSSNNNKNSIADNDNIGISESASIPANTNDSKERTSANMKPTRDGSKEMSKEASRRLSSEDATKTLTDNGVNPAKPAVTVASSFKSNETVPIVNVNVKETVQVFNQIAALREKSSGVGHSSARPLSDASSSSQSGSAASSSGQQQSSTSTEFSRAPLGPSGQSYKQRSIRATLAPKASSDANKDTQDRSTSSSSSVSDVATGHEHSGNSKLATSSSSSTSSQSDHHHHNYRQTHGSTKEPVKAAATPTTTTTTTTAHHHDGKSQQHPHSASQKHTASHGSNQAQSSLSDQHNHDHNHQHNHRQAPLVKGKSSAAAAAPATCNNLLNSASSRLPATNGHRNHHHQSHSDNHKNNHDASPSLSNSSGRSRGSSSLQQQHQHQHQASDEQVTSNESYVSVLNHCFDDIEKFILRIQHAYAAVRELQAKKRHTKRSATAGHSHKSPSNGPLPPLPPSLSASELARLVAQAHGPNADDYFEILSKFKLAFNLLAKLKGCIHEPNAPELVHFLFTPLAIIIESARNLTPPVDPTVVGIPYLNRDALDLLSNCCTSKESDLWLSLGPNWTETIDPQLLKASRLPTSFQPIFSDGWAPVINELELIGLVVPPVTLADDSGGQYYSGGLRLGAGPPHTNLDKSAREVTREGALLPPPPLPPPSSTSSPSVANSKPAKTKRISRSGAMNPRYADLAFQTGYRHPSDYLVEPGDLIEDVKTMIDVGPPTDPYRVPEVPMDHQLNYQHQHRSARHQTLMAEKAPRNDLKHTQAQGRGRPRKNLDYIGHDQYTPPTMLNDSFIGPKEDDLNGRYAASYSTNPSNDYTELELGRPQNSQHYVASGSSGYHGDNLLNHQPTAQQASSNQSRRKASKSYYNRQYQTDPLYEDRGNELLAHEAEREAMLIDIGPAQTEWFYELKLRGALIVRVLFTREANNDKELTVKRGEILEILDDTRKWWKARNIDLQVAYVPHTIVAVMEHYQTLDELLTGSSGEIMMVVNDKDQAAHVDPERYTYRDQVQLTDGFQNHYYGFREERHNSKTANGAFRYF